jgi:hypothetical protein
MIFSKKFIEFTSSLLLLFFSIGCVSQSKRTIPLDESRPVNDKFVILHWEDNEFQITDISLDDKQLHAVLHPPAKYYAEAQELHIFVDSTFVPPEVLPENITLNFSAISRVEIHEVDVGKTVTKTVWATIGCLGCSIGLVFLVALLTKNSCPFVYVFNGESFEFTGEIYSGSIHPPLERHDYLPLPNLVPIEDAYQIKISNEIHEIQHTNLAELLIFDHPVGVDVLVDKYGIPHTLSDLQGPLTALNVKNEDISDQIAGIDSLIYIGEMIQEEDSPMETIILSFPRPVGTDQAKLVVNGKNSFWLDYLYGQFYELFGDRYNDWSEDRKDASESKMRKWSLDQGIPLSVYIEKDGQWEFADYFHVAGPMALKKDVLSLDISDVETANLNIKLEFGYFFWEIDYLAIDYSRDLEVQQSVVSLIKAIDQKGGDVADLLNSDDDNYYTQSEIGDFTILKFTTPDLSADSKRTMVLHSKGHYEIIRNPEGKPDVGLLSSFKNPGRFAEFSKQRFLKIYGDLHR